MNFRNKILLSLAISQISLASAAPPDAGSLQQQFRNEQPQLPQESIAPVPKAAEKLPSTGETMVVNAFRFMGNTIISDEILTALISSYTARPITFNELQFATVEIGELYRQSGWVARVYVPEQEVVDGIVTLQIIEGKFGTWRLNGDEPQRYDTDRVTNYIEQVQKKDVLLNTKQLDRALLLLDDLPGVNVVGSLAAGATESTTDLLLQLADESFIDSQINVDNHGARSTGKERLNGEIFIKSPLKKGDQLRGYLSHSQGNDYIWMNYTIPVGYDGWRVGVNASYLEYDVITSEFSSLQLEGQSMTWGLDANYPLIRERSQNLYLGLAYEGKQYENESMQIKTSDYDIDSYSLSLTGNSFDRFGGGGANFANISLTAGDNDLGALQASENPTLDGNFTKLNFTISRQQVMTNDVSIFGRLSGQLADTNLDSSEKMYLGGTSGVRAYPVNEGGGDQGLLAQLELRYRATNAFVVTGFYDWGQVRQNINNLAGDTPNTYQLKGAGVAVTWTGPKGIMLEGTYAHRISNNPNALINGKDQDGSLDKNRFWLSASMSF